MTELSRKQEDLFPTCHECDCIKYCTFGRPNKKKDNCPMIVLSEVEKKARELYKNDDFIKESTKIASIVEATGYIHWPRLKDTIEYARGMKYKKLGIAFCLGLHDEVKRIAQILQQYEFEVISVCCKTGGVPKVKVGVPEEFTMWSKTGYPVGAVTCNPVAQALLLNHSETDLNIIVGLCVGHDITFTHLSKAPVTTLIAKDRSSPHNPSSCLFTSYGRTFFSKDRGAMIKEKLKNSQK